MPARACSPSLGRSCFATTMDSGSEEDAIPARARAESPDSTGATISTTDISRAGAVSKPGILTIWPGRIRSGLEISGLSLQIFGQSSGLLRYPPLKSHRVSPFCTACVVVFSAKRSLTPKTPQTEAMITVLATIFFMQCSFRNGHDTNGENQPHIKRPVVSSTQDFRRLSSRGCESPDFKTPVNGSCWRSAD